ncbi:CYTH domain-containing protein [Prauserella cavernicola]|uniref:CYTH domain-containing protein n=1 Tax=Prauserella cavernicola TaxID=2800127 RepID=A0A934R047_9PSEU|nr:CYTH domain-containing protein [Prauserella cavernicola]MBK1788423.1 CYTH domain-containing protein [Prauserella cavernicola]
MIEREAKFELDLDAAVPRLDGVGPVSRQAEPVKSVLEATYYDVRDHRLLGSGITLRRRTGGTDAGWHLKLPRPDGHREEVAEPLGSTSSIPAPLAEKVRDRTGDEPLVPVARITTTRFSYSLLDGQDRPLATLVDDHVTAEAGKGTGPDSWRELEVELTDDADDSLLDQVTEALRGIGVLPSTWPSKLRRVLGEHLPPAAG